MRKTFMFYLILVACLISLTRTAPSPESDMGDSSFDGLVNQNVDYNTVMSHFKDFFMYLPVMFTTFKDTMSGFPKLAESIKILASPYAVPYHDGEDCKCKTKSTQNSNEIEKTSSRNR